MSNRPHLFEAFICNTPLQAPKPHYNLPCVCVYVCFSPPSPCHLSNGDWNHSDKCDADMGFREPRACLILCHPVSCQTLWQWWFPGSGWCGIDALQHWWLESIFTIWVPCHGSEQCGPWSAQHICGNANWWAGTILSSSESAGQNAELKHSAGAVGAAWGAKRPHQGLQSILHTGCTLVRTTQCLVQAQHGWCSTAGYHLQPGTWHHLQPTCAGIHSCGRRTTIAHTAD